MEDIYIRSAVIKDLPVLYEFEQGIVSAERPYDETLKPGHINYYDLKLMIDSSKTEVIVAETSNELIGSAYVDIRAASSYLNHSYYGYLGFMYVKPEYRGQGVNKKIVEELKSWARKKGITELRLDVYDENDSAIKAYEKAGFSRHMIKMRMTI